MGNDELFQECSSSLSLSSLSLENACHKSFLNDFLGKKNSLLKSNFSPFLHNFSRSEDRLLSTPASQPFQTLPFAWIFSHPPKKSYPSSPPPPFHPPPPTIPSQIEPPRENLSINFPYSSHSYSKSNRHSYKRNTKKSQFNEFFTSSGVIISSTMLVSLKVVTILYVQIFIPRIWPLLRTIILLSVPFKPIQKLLPLSVKKFLFPFQFFTKPLLGLYVSGQFVKNLFPDAWRTLCFWKRLLPIYSGYMKTKRRVRNLPIEKRHVIWEKRHNWGGKKVHNLIVEMSGYYIKSAQIFASKSDFMPKPWVKCLTPLFDDCPARSFREVSKNICTQLQQSPIVHSLTQSDDLAFNPEKSKKVKLDQIFASVESTPIASASIAQVHCAVLLDGRNAVIKIQHFNMDRTMHSDLRNIARVAKFLKNQLPFDLSTIVKEIQSTIPLEFDFQREVFFMQKIKQIMQKHNFDDDVLCPSPYVEFCSNKMIVMQRLHGIPFTKIFLELSNLPMEDIVNARMAVHKLIESYGAMLLVEGTFHADPHPGNIFLLPGGKIGLLDYGQAKVLDASTKRHLAKLISALGDGEPSKIAKQLTACGMIFGKSDASDVGGDRDDVAGGKGDVTADRMLTQQGNGPDDVTLSKMAYVLFDTRFMEDAVVSPLSDHSILKSHPLISFNQELWLVVRTVLLLRGLCHTLQMDVSGVDMWQKFIPKYLLDDEDY